MIAQLFYITVTCHYLLIFSYENKLTTLAVFKTEASCLSRLQRQWFNMRYLLRVSDRLLRHHKIMQIIFKKIM